MANRVIGGFNMSSNYEVSVKKPLDARSLVPSYEALITKSNWVTSENKPVVYNGMLVAVANTSDTSKNGLYFLFDPNCTTTLKTPDVTVESNWIKIGETSDISALVTRLTNIESELSGVNDRLTALESLEAEDKVHSYGYRKDFPTEGQQNHMYIAADQHRTYIFVGGSYLPIADQFEYIDHDGNSETPKARILYGGSAN